MLVAKIPADHLAGMAVDKDDAAAARILQHGAEKVGAQAIKVDLALRVDVVEQRLEQCQRRLVAEACIARADRLDVQVGSRAQLAPDVLPPTRRKPRKVFIVRAEI